MTTELSLKECKSAVLSDHGSSSIERVIEACSDTMDPSNFNELSQDERLAYLAPPFPEPKSPGRMAQQD
jgi:hypothetical protein